MYQMELMLMSTELMSFVHQEQLQLCKLYSMESTEESQKFINKFLIIWKVYNRNTAGKKVTEFTSQKLINKICLINKQKIS